jgi:hypothetical protein
MCAFLPYRAPAAKGGTGREPNFKLPPRAAPKRPATVAVSLGLRRQWGYFVAFASLSAAAPDSNCRRARRA